ncbi:MAG TPA: hypothetical protein VIR55_08480 [Ignavibacteria bacterium]
MAKQQSFADKAAKAGKEKGVKCPKCENIKQPLLVVQAIKNEKNGSTGFLKRRVAVCKCNEQEIYG